MNSRSHEDISQASWNKTGDLHGKFGSCDFAPGKRSGNRSSCFTQNNPTLSLAVATLVPFKIFYDTKTKGDATAWCDAY